MMCAVIDRGLAAVAEVLATTPHVMFCIKGVDGTYLAANQAFADRAGVAAVGDVVGRSASDLFPADLVERAHDSSGRSISAACTATSDVEHAVETPTAGPVRFSR